MDPHVNYESYGSELHYNIYETLYTYPRDPNVDRESSNPTEPLLATSYEVSDDGKTWTFHLRQGVKFHDGTPFNASCVQYNFFRAVKMFDPSGPVWMIVEPINGGDYVESLVYGEHPEWWNETSFNYWVEHYNPVEVIDTYTVAFHLAYPFAPFLAAMTYEVGAQVSPTYVEKHGGVQFNQHNSWMDEHTCGTGPYTLKYWSKGEAIVLERFNDYWGWSQLKSYDPNAGNVKLVVYQKVEDVTSRMLALKTGDADFVYWPTTHAFEIYDPATGESKDPNIRVVAKKPTFTVMFLGFNMFPTYTDVLTNATKDNPFVDKNVRIAFSYAFNYQQFIENVTNGFGIQLEGPIPKGMFAHADNLTLYSYDLNKAKQYLQAAGYSTSNKLDITIYYNSGNTVRETACLMLKSSLEETGMVTASVQALDWPTYLGALRGHKLPIYFLGWAPDYADPHNYVQPFLYSTGLFPYYTGYSNSTIDNLIDQAARATDPHVREKLYYQIQVMAIEDVPFIWVYQATSFHVERTWIHGWWFNPMHGPYYGLIWSSKTTNTTSSFI